MGKTHTPAIDSSTESEGFEIGSISTVCSSEFELKHPTTGRKLGAYFTLAGPEHPQRKQWGLDIIRSSRARSSDLLKDPEDEIEDLRARTVASVLGWRGIKKDGINLQFSEVAASELLLDVKNSWMLMQVMNNMGRTELFISA